MASKTRSTSSRTALAMLAVAALGLAACGGSDGPSAMSEEDFLDELADICDDTRNDLEDLDEPSDLSDFEAFAEDVSKVYEDGLERLGALVPPSDLVNDYEDFVGNIEDQLKRVGDLGEAGADNDEDKVNTLFERMSKLEDEQSELAQELDVESCDPKANETTDTTEPSVATTAAPPTVPVTTAPSLTLPATVPPVTQQPPDTGAPPPSGTFEIVNLTEVFIAPDGFLLEHAEPTPETLDLFAQYPDLSAVLGGVGTATLVSAADGSEVAEIWVGVTNTDGVGMAADWKTIDCPTGDLRTSANGLAGIICFGSAESPYYEIFTATFGDFGISIYTLVPDIPGDLVADAFFEANPG
jgi:hypothetical protein